jgi:hypothetical protein
VKIRDPFLSIPAARQALKFVDKKKTVCRQAAIQSVDIKIRG